MDCSAEKSLRRLAWQSPSSGSCGPATALPSRSSTTGTTCSRSREDDTGAFRSRQASAALAATAAAYASREAAGGGGTRDTAQNRWTHSSPSTHEHTTSCACQSLPQTGGLGSRGVTAAGGLTWASCIASKLNAVDLLVPISVSEIKTAEPKETALDQIGRLSGVSAKSGQRAGTRSCCKPYTAQAATSRWFAEDRAE